MTYTVRFAHLHDTTLMPGQVVRHGEAIGVMGNTGASAGAHLHLDVIKSVRSGRYNLEDMANDNPEPAAKQAMLFIDTDLFGVDPEITTGYADPAYYKARGKTHFGFDVVPKDRHETKAHYTIRWNRSVPGRVVKVMENDPGYGNCVQISYEI